MQLYMNKLMSDRPIAVQFKSKAEAKIFFDEMKEHYPRYVRGWFNFIYPYSEEKLGCVCYCPYFNEKDGSMTHGTKDVYIDHGIRVIEFDELLYDEDEVDITESEVSLNFLLD